MNDPFEIEEMLIRAATEFPDVEERARFLAWACRGDDGLRARMEKLLSIQENSDRFFDFKPFEIADEKGDDLAADAEDDGDGGEIGLRIGRYRLIRRLGEGGCGVVYQAEQETPVKRQVALKLVRVGLDHEQVIARFEMERQSLAMMDHPGIARVLDAGATPTGRPFFVMQWVTGEPITEFCEKNRLSIRQRLELFIRVCHAIQHAHQKGVIHRDIKPSNVLASFHDAVPLPKIIDFGIAKATGGGQAETDGDQEPILGTPNYMSPEQGLRGGLDVDTRTDIFSLGVLLCEILVGQTPFGSVENTVIHTGELQQTLARRLPKTPSTILSECPPAELAGLAAARACKPRDLIRQVKGDLDAIVMKCLQTSRQHRYDTASALAADIERHLDDRLVTARTAGRRDVLAKLLRRNRFPFAVGGVAFFTLAAGFGTSTWLFFRESEARREQAQLRGEAEAARTVESKLRAQAEAREACAQAAVKLSYGQIEEADQLLAAIPTDLAPSSLEAADVYRRVGEWHRQAGRIQQAAERFTALAGAISSVDRSDLYKISGDLLPAAVATCEVGDWPRYEQVRRVALDRFGATQNPIVAEQIIKACMLRPADPPTMEKIATLGIFLENSIGPVGMNVGGEDVAGWQCYSLALWHHRRGDPAQTIRWGELSLQRSMNAEPRVLCVRMLLAMSHHRMGETDEARKLLTDAAKPLRAVMDSTSGKWSDDRSLWVDWMNAKILLQEAESIIGASVAE
jgi:tRNA A-37 threonylcarbamoyl transferase component Bud32